MPFLKTACNQNIAFWSKSKLSKLNWSEASDQTGWNQSNQVQSK